jgi:hypothetical protein
MVGDIFFRTIHESLSVSNALEDHPMVCFVRRSETPFNDLSHEYCAMAALGKSRGLVGSKVPSF